MRGLAHARELRDEKSVMGAELMDTACGCAADLVNTLNPEYAEATR